MPDYTKPTPETDAFMAKIDGDEIDLEMVRAKLRDMEIERDYLKDALLHAVGTCFTKHAHDHFLSNPDNFIRVALKSNNIISSKQEKRP